MAFVTELFLDNEMIEVTPGVSRRLHQPKKHLLNPIISSKYWWEGEGIQPYATMYDEEEKLFKMWARCVINPTSCNADGNAAYTVYLTSNDGIHWDKSELGVIDIGGRKDHNVVFTDYETDNVDLKGKEGFVVPKDLSDQGKKGFIWSVIKNPNPRNVKEKYIGLAFLMKRRGAHLCTSPDGIHWSCENVPFWQTPHDVAGNGDDALMHMIFDKAKEKWVVYRRVIPEFSERMIADESDIERKRADRYYRSYAYTESEDLKEWKNHKFILSMDADDRDDTELYQFSCHKYGQIYVGYMSVYYLRHPQPIDIQLVTSRDGLNFTRVCRGKPFIPSGPLGYYDYMAMGCSQPEPIIVNDNTYIYYAAANFPHDLDVYDPNIYKCGVALATFKRDRFVSLETGEPGPSRVVTKPFTVQYPKLYINASTWENGLIRVELLTRDWQAISGFTESESIDISGDALDHPVQWKDNIDMSKLLGKEIRVKFYMIRARIHAMTLSDENRKLNVVDSTDQYDNLKDSTPKLI